MTGTKNLEDLSSKFFLFEKSFYICTSKTSIFIFKNRIKFNGI